MSIYLDSQLLIIAKQFERLLNTAFSMNMNKYLHSLCLVFLFILSSCVAGKTVVSDSADLDRYEYAALTDVMNYNGDAALMELEVKIFDVLEKTRLAMVGDRRIDDLTPSQKEKLLLVRFSATQTDDEAIVSVNFVDYMTGRPVASCKGEFGMGLDKDDDLDGAVKKVGSEIKKLFGGK